MADHAKPILTDNYTDVLSQIRGRFEDQAKGFDPANTTATNISTGTIRWNSAEKKFQKWSGTTWGDLTDNYVLSGATFSTGTANGVAYLNGSKVLTTSSALTFNGADSFNFGGSSASAYNTFGVNNTASNGFARMLLNIGSSGANGVGAVKYAPGIFFAIGTDSDSSSTPMVFNLGNASEQMRLTSTGLGIGTSSPENLLQAAARFGVSSSGVVRWGQTVTVLGRANSGYLTWDTGLVALGYEGAGAIRFDTNSLERMRLDASGNLGLGVTPSANSLAGSGYRGFEIGTTVGTGLYAGGNELYSQVNAYYNSGFKYATGAAATQYLQSAGSHKWLTAPSGTAGNAISFTQAMTLDASGNLGIGTTSPSQKLDVSGIVRSVVGSGHSFQALRTSDFYYSHFTADGIDTYTNTNSSAPMLFKTGGTERMRIDSSGNLLVGNTNGTSRITASGVIESTTGGFKFPDGTTQTTAATAPTTSNVLAATAGAAVGGVGTYAFCRVGSGAPNPGDTVAGSNLSYTDGFAESIFTAIGVGTWRCMGKVFVSDRGTLFLRIA